MSERLKSSGEALHLRMRNKPSSELVDEEDEELGDALGEPFEKKKHQI